MARTNLNLRYNLRDPQATHATPINLIVRYSNKKFIYPTNERIHPKNWQNDKAKKFYQLPKPSGTHDYAELTARLTDLKSAAERVFLKFQLENGNDVVPTPKKYKELLDIERGRSKAPAKSLLPFIKDFIVEAKRKPFSKDGAARAATTIKKYNTTLRHLEAYAKHIGKRIDFDDIDLNFRENFIRFLMDELNLATNSIGKYITTLKTFLNEATERGINKNLTFKSNRFFSLAEEADTIYLTSAEIKLIEGLDLTGNKTLETVRDIFVVGCYTGLRYSDLKALRPEHISNDIIEIEMAKTKRKVAVPVLPSVEVILKKYNNNLPRVFSNQKTNQYLKEIGEKVKELDVPITKIITKGGIRQTLTFKKWELITTHTARRSFATNAYLSKFGTIGTMRLTGHKTQSSFLKYIRVTPTDAAKLFKEHNEKLLASYTI
ncbi:MAG TPA: site-specific integrase [Flavisolibacter sp.]|jgi:integrase|nr:site-specific integrase [Flavisolibacter sp.]